MAKKEFDFFFVFHLNLAEEKNI